MSKFTEFKERLTNVLQLIFPADRYTLDINLDFEPEESYIVRLQFTENPRYFDRFAVVYMRSRDTVEDRVERALNDLVISSQWECEVFEDRWLRNLTASYRNYNGLLKRLFPVKVGV